MLDSNFMAAKAANAQFETLVNGQEPAHVSLTDDDMAGVAAIEQYIEDQLTIVFEGE